MTPETKADMWQRRAVTMHDIAKGLAERLSCVQSVLKDIHIEYSRVVSEAVTTTRALNAMGRLATEAGLVHRYCSFCGEVWEVTNPQPGSASGASTCDACMMQHQHWNLELSEEYELAE